MSIQLNWPAGSHKDCELIVFDKDGTIIDFKSIWLNMAAGRAVWLANKLSSNSSELFTWRERFLRAAGIEPQTGEISLAGPIVNLSFENQSYCLATLLHSLLPNKYPWEQALDLANQSIEEALHQNDPASLATAIEGAFEFIKEVAQSGIKLALITSDSTDNAERTLERFGVRNLFCCIKGSDILPAKPSPIALLNVCKQAGIDPSRTIVIGDAPNDVRMGNEANIPVLCLEGLASAEQLMTIGATAAFKTWNDLSFKKNEIPISEVLLLRTDGASRGNPGPAAIGFIILDSQGNQIYQLGKPIGKQTNNFAEYIALLEGLKKVLSFAPNELIIEMDSELIVKQIKGLYKVKDEKLKEIYTEVKALLANFKGKWQIRHIFRKENSGPDQLCNHALDQKTQVY